MPYEQILYEVADGIATVTLNRPGKLNAWTPVMENEVYDAMAAAAADDAVRVILLTGAGRGFCSGADIARLTQFSDGQAQPARRELSGDAWLRDARPELRARFVCLMAVPKPVIAVVNGPAVGAGFVLACCCDMRIASADAVVLTAFSRLGLIAEHGIAWLLPRLIGSAAAMDLMLSSRKVSAAEGLALGLFNRVVAPDRLMAEAREYAKMLVDTISPRSLRVIKRQMWDAQFQDFGEALSSATDELHQSFESSDFREGISHYVEKRKPNFAGS